MNKTVSSLGSINPHLILKNVSISDTEHKGNFGVDMFFLGAGQSESYRLIVAKSKLGVVVQDIFERFYNE